MTSRPSPLPSPRLGDGPDPIGSPSWEAPGSRRSSTGLQGAGNHNIYRRGSNDTSGSRRGSFNTLAGGPPAQEGFGLGIGQVILEDSSQQSRVVASDPYLVDGQDAGATTSRQMNVKNLTLPLDDQQQSPMDPTRSTVGSPTPSEGLTPSLGSAARGVRRKPVPVVEQN